MSTDAGLLALIRAIAGGTAETVESLLEADPSLARASLEGGATRQDSCAFFLDAIGHHVYAGDTALHVAAAAYRHEIVGRLLALGADVGAANRRGARALHYAADGMPGSPGWHAQRQAATVACLIAGGADPDAVDSGGVTALHRAVRNCCSAAAKTLLDGGADPGRATKRGSTPMSLATRNTGRGGTGLPEAKSERHRIVDLLQERIGRKG